MEESFQNYCIVCDRLIATPPPGPEEKKPLNAGGKRRAVPAGAIRIRNRDGTTTTRTANGEKTTKPTVRYGARLTNPAIGANPSRVVPKAPTTLTTQPPALTPSPSSVGSGNNVPCSSPKIDAVKVVTPPPPEPFVSNIYCSRTCADQDAGSSSANAADLGRALGVGFTYSDALVAAGLHVSPNAAPPSPLLGSDTDSSNGVRGIARTPDAIGGHSVPNTLEFFRLSRDSPDSAWRESRTMRPSIDAAVQQQMIRQRSSGPHSASGTSSDSLASMWAGDQDSNSRRSSSNVGSLCAMTPMHTLTPDSMASARRSMSSSSDGSGVQQQQAPLTRSTLSHTSLGGLTSPALNAVCPQVGSAPSHTAYLMQAYASGFPARDGAVLSPPLLSGSATPRSRSTSVAIAPVPQRSTTSTVVRNMRSRQGSTGATWDSFAKAEIRDRARRNTGSSTQGFAVGSLPKSPDPERRGRQDSYAEATPKQSFEIEHGGWQIRYMKPEQQRRSGSKSRSRSRGPSSRYAPSSPVPAASTAMPLPIPVRARPGPSTLASSNSTAHSRTPLTSGTPIPSRDTGLSPTGSRISSRYSSSAALPDIGGLQVDANSLGLAAAALSNGPATGTTPTTAPLHSASPGRSGSIPRPGFDWEKRTEHRTYELPKGVVQNPNKGLFYFNV
ncbi:hypothetical protein CspeluHIS016_0304410 [Cutaneotrichosporon spelunceum]|uniref:Uncharacterized protein n=1 Tax=Cutaneotrichosporon spelunceum TaxID=1672016 RepID=A0AAD3YB34_9TREE|nr:hypothetical protein CspeluHIS016_0304410 [Cutaneotrichosporon spelunceum]